jgi:hypothetical protein
MILKSGGFTIRSFERSRRMHPHNLQFPRICNNQDIPPQTVSNSFVFEPPVG